jgi:hypothetical protein
MRAELHQTFTLRHQKISFLQATGAILTQVTKYDFSYFLQILPRSEVTGDWFLGIKKPHSLGGGG